ncbi:hypothetical protein K438DRAFT_1836205 [Mycena galopus ATCC 62051]|nr:hypothetical protein K438DRAFT_1836205 [Mycena galopus ATCC 62051]
MLRSMRIWARLYQLKPQHPKLFPPLRLLLHIINPPPSTTFSTMQGSRSAAAPPKGPVNCLELNYTSTQHFLRVSE